MTETTQDLLTLSRKLADTDTLTAYVTTLERMVKDLDDTRSLIPLAENMTALTKSITDLTTTFSTTTQRINTLVNLLQKQHDQNADALQREEEMMSVLLTRLKEMT